jgi:CheY-like chemotaxis protein
VTITDDGPGIPPAIADRVFEPFFTTKSTGTGLGLATVRSIVSQHGGTVTFTSRPGEGTTFRVLLRSAGEATAAPPERLRPAPPRSQGQARILVMDDEPHIRNLLKVGLELEGYEVVSTADGHEAVAVHRQAFTEGRPFDLAILDLTVAGGTGGLDTLPRLRNTDPALRVVASSGYARNDTSAELKASGFDGILPKPYKLDDLAATVAALLR